MLRLKLRLFRRAEAGRDGGGCRLLPSARAKRYRFANYYAKPKIDRVVISPSYRMRRTIVTYARKDALAIDKFAFNIGLIITLVNPAAFAFYGRRRHAVSLRVRNTGKSGQQQSHNYYIFHGLHFIFS
ncbi:MAG: hypothetical protein LBO78_01160 [Rickettsiales bacterium]|jgi:hypothetical protein|nr:hypothetical protein [Rickettsiales bacterium]